MELLEVVRGAASSPSTVATAMAIGKRINKVAVLSGVCHGFIGNRMLFQRGIEANKIILEGVTPAQVDRVLYDFGFPMGPFAMSDLAGLDIGWKAETSNGASIRDLLARAAGAARRTAAATTRTTRRREPRHRPIPRSR